jgi:hypothetical protein
LTFGLVPASVSHWSGMPSPSLSRSPGSAKPGLPKSSPEPAPGLLVPLRLSASVTSGDVVPVPPAAGVPAVAGAVPSPAAAMTSAVAVPTPGIAAGPVGVRPLPWRSCVGAWRTTGVLMCTVFSFLPPGWSWSGQSVQPRSGALRAPTPSTPATSPAATVPANRRSRRPTERVLRRASRLVFVSDMF